RALRRAGAAPGDDVWVTGTPGDAAGALAALQAGAAVDRALRARLDRPQPRVVSGRALAGLASACVDVSDGLLADLGHVCEASGVGATIELDALPTSPALARFRPELRWPWQASGGDDYELCFTAPPGRRDAIALALQAAGETVAARIGRIDVEAGVRALRPDGAAWTPAVPGYRHF